MTKQSVYMLIGTTFVVVLGLGLAWTALSDSTPAQDASTTVEIQVREGDTYTVPDGQVAVITYLGDDSITITDVGISVDGKKVLNANETDEPDSTNVLVVVCGGSTIQVHGGLMGEADALCRGILVARNRTRLTCQ